MVTLMMMCIFICCNFVCVHDFMRCENKYKKLVIFNHNVKGIKTSLRDED